MNVSAFTSSLLMTFVTFAAFSAPQDVSLSGSWHLRLDPKNAGVTEKWFAEPIKAQETVKLPGSLPAQGIGDDVSLDTPWMGGIQDPNWAKNPVYAPYTAKGDFKFPFWLQPDKYYAGAAWYEREIEVPADWEGKRVVLTLERPHWATRVWVDSRDLGEDKNLSTPHVYDLGNQLKPGKHRLTLRVDNGLVVDVGVNSHCVTDHTQGNWNGVVGDIKLEVTPQVCVADLQVYPAFSKQSVTVRGTILNTTGKAGAGVIELRVDSQADGKSRSDGEPLFFDVQWEQAGGTFEFPLRVKNPKMWDEFEQNLYVVSARVGEVGEYKKATFGFRDLTTQGTQFLLNGRKTFFRGTLECCIFPRTGHPPTDSDSWKRIVRVAKEHGLNMIRFHSYCPPEAAFVAADELGFYYQVETCWANQSTTIGDGKPVDQWVYDETDRILKAYGNHPSFVLMTYGNEPGGRNANAYLAKYVNAYKQKDPRRLWTSGSGWPQLPENQFHVTPDPRVQGWGEGLKSRINARPPETQTDYREYIQKRTVPVISHEIGQWCVYPNFEEIRKYTGYLKARNFEIFQANLKAHHMGDQARDFLRASGKLQTLCYKEDIESALRTPGMGGFQLLDLHDFPGQGTALVGVLDPFWESKGYVTASEFRRFCNTTVPLARMNKRVFTTGEDLEADLEVAHFGAAPLQNALVIWSVVDDAGKVLQSARIEKGTIPVDNGIGLGKVSVPLNAFAAPARYRLVVRIEPGGQPSSAGNKDKVAFENDWDFWVYPASTAPAELGDVVVVHELDERALATLSGGGKVLLNVPPDCVKGDAHGRVALGFSSIFWNTAWTGRQPPHTLGILCDPKHPLFASFPTDAHSNWQWWYLISRAGALILEGLPENLRPTVQVVDDWVTNRRLGLVLEAKVGKGKLLVTSIDLTDDLQSRVVARQFRDSLVAYMKSPEFNPSISVEPGQVRGLYTERSALKKLGARVIRASSAQPGYEPENALDGDLLTFWHTAWGETATKPPHEIVIAFDKAVSLRGLRITFRQDGNKNGWVKDYEVYASRNWKEWGAPAAKGELKATAEAQAIQLSKLAEAQFIRIVVLSGHEAGSWASIAEIDLLQ